MSCQHRTYQDFSAAHMAAYCFIMPIWITLLTLSFTAFASLIINDGVKSILLRSIKLRKKYGYNEITEKKANPLILLGKILWNHQGNSNAASFLLLYPKGRCVLRLREHSGSFHRQWRQRCQLVTWRHYY